MKKTWSKKSRDTVPLIAAQLTCLKSAVRGHNNFFLYALERVWRVAQPVRQHGPPGQGASLTHRRHVQVRISARWSKKSLQIIVYIYKTISLIFAYKIDLLYDDSYAYLVSAANNTVQFLLPILFCTVFYNFQPFLGSIIKNNTKTFTHLVYSVSA